MCGDTHHSLAVNTNNPLRVCIWQVGGFVSAYKSSEMKFAISSHGFESEPWKQHHFLLHIYVATILVFFSLLQLVSLLYNNSYKITKTDDIRLQLNTKPIRCYEY